MQRSIRKIPQKYSGFTLIELMTTLSVAAIAIALATPSFSNVVLNNRMASSHNLILSALATTRSEAITRGTNVTVCASTNRTSCNSSNWENGWIIFSDYNGNQIINAGTNNCLPGEDCLLTVKGTLGNGITVRNDIFANAGWVQYNSQGVVDSAGTFIMCDKRNERRASAININYIGHARKAVDSNNPEDNIVNDLDGANVVCP